MELEINKIIDDIDKYKLSDLNTEIIKNRKNEILKQILDDDEFKKYKPLLNDYRYVDEVDELRIGSYIRYFVLKDNDDDLKLARGGFIMDIQQSSAVITNNVFNFNYYAYPGYTYNGFRLFNAIFQNNISVKGAPFFELNAWFCAR
jgi:hypothetical protein